MDPALALARIPNRPPRADLALAAALLAWGLLEALFADGPGSTAWRIAFALLITVPLAFRRQGATPVMLFVVAVTLANALSASQEEMGAISFPCLLVATFSVALYARPAAVAVAGLGLAAIWGVAMFTSDYYGGGQGPTDYAIISFFIAGSWVAGWVVRRRAAQTRHAPPGQLAEAVRTVAAGDSLLAPAVTKRLVERFVRRPPPDAVRRERFDELTDRELEVLTLMTRGMSNGEIGGALFLSEATVKTHVTRVLSKLGVRDRVQAVVLAYETGLVEPGGASG